MLARRLHFLLYIPAALVLLLENTANALRCVADRGMQTRGARRESQHWDS
jgi:hypothetical protein